MKRLIICLVAFATSLSFIALLAGPALSQAPVKGGATGKKAPPGKKGAEVPKSETAKSPDDLAKTTASIQWYATLSRGLAEAERTGKPILFVSGNPSCAGVSGMWCPGKGIIDSTFMFKAEVIEAAKKFVCIRLTTYEDASEKAFIAKLVRGEVSNTSFSILSPEGKPLLALKGTGKGPGEYYSDSADMAKGMAAFAEKYTPKKIDGIPSLPIALSAKAGLVIAAADNQPLIVILAEDEKKQKELEAQVAEKAWSKDFQGRFVYATAGSMKELPKVQGHSITEGVVLIEPDMFGAGGKVVKQVSTAQVPEMLADSMTQVYRNFAPISKTRRELAAKGLKEGIFYETGISVSGAGEAADRDRYKQQLDKQKSSSDK